MEIMEIDVVLKVFKRYEQLFKKILLFFSIAINVFLIIFIVKNISLIINSIKNVFSLELKEFLIFLFLEFLEFELQVFRFLLLLKENVRNFFVINIAYIIGHLFAFVMPLRSVGEVARIERISKVLGKDIKDIFLVVLIERILDVLILAIFLFFSFVVISFNFPKLSIYLFLVLPLLIFYYFNLHIPFLISVSLWIVDFLRVYLIFLKFKFFGNFINVIFSTSLSYLSIVFSIFPGGLIVFESFMVFSSFKMFPNKELAISSTLTERFFSYWLFVILGIPTYAIFLILKRRHFFNKNK